MQVLIHIRRCILCLLLPLCCTLLPAEVVVSLRSGQTVTGEILFQDEDVIVVKDTDGRRYQFPVQEVAEVADQTKAPAAEAVKEQRQKKVGVILQLNGGGAALPAGNGNGNALWGAEAGGSIMIGACNLMNRHLFAGGGIGYNAYIIQGKTWSFLPVMLTARLPLMQTLHAPAVGLSVGYGIPLSAKQKGGFYTAVDAGWRYQMSEKTALFVGVSAGIQQAGIEITEIIENNRYTYSANRCLCSVGLKLAMQF